ncbi:L2 protein [Rusa timorensis papillomavirus 1]|uniref:Minor capsid protein L2 n=1 Tax=Rusa timorensis papillomavirus 1 TaxID=2847277 RepID=A0A0X9JQ64_9PAPI|nr:L2 protein [Rusa timorensis papillomavirus 1]ALX18467.1 L2 protein [Rusa timorensis papillomavirus 1]
MVRAARRKRASEDDLYRNCRLGGDCPVDIKNKYEQNTLADNILKWVSNFLWFGTLGIGTGKGTGGSTGYTRLGGAGPGVRQGIPTITRPNIIVDAVGPAEGIPIDVVDPSSSAIVPLLEAPVDPSGGDLENIAEVAPTHTNGGLDPVIIGAPDEEAPVIEVQEGPAPTPPVRSRTSTTVHNNPSYHSIVASSDIPGETAASDQIFITDGLRAEFIGGSGFQEAVFPSTSGPYQEIPLDTFQDIDVSDTLHIEEPPRASTPRESVGQSLNRNMKRLRTAMYGRRTQQVRVENPRFLSSPGRLVQFEYSNPAFQDEVTLEFERDVSAVEEAPEFDFRDIVRLGRPRYSETNTGYVRVSRLGRRGTIRTRQGTQIGGAAHYYTDISSIHEGDSMELSLIGSHNNEATLVQSSNEGVFVDMEEAQGGVAQGYDDEELLDDTAEDFSRGRLIVSTGDTTYSIGRVSFGYAEDTARDFAGTVVFPDGQPSEYPQPGSPTNPTSIPTVLINVYDEGLDFLLHPSMFPKRKRRKLAFL